MTMSDDVMAKLDSPNLKLVRSVFDAFGRRNIDAALGGSGLLAALGLVNTNAQKL